MCDLNRTNGQTFVLVTHSLEVGQRAHRIVRMRDGRIIIVRMRDGRIIEDDAVPGPSQPDEGRVELPVSSNDGED